MSNAKRGEIDGATHAQCSVFAKQKSGTSKMFEQLGAGLGLGALLNGSLTPSSALGYWLAYIAWTQCTVYFNLIVSMFIARVYPLFVQTFEIIDNGQGGLKKRTEIMQILSFFARTNPNAINREYSPDAIDDDITFNMAPGTYTLRYRNSWVIMQFSKHTGAIMMNPNVVTLKIWTISFDRTFYDNLINDSNQTIQKVKSLYTMTGRNNPYSDMGIFWKRYGPVPSRRWANTIISDENYKLLTGAFARYQSRTQKEIDMEIPHRLCIVLSGPPGFGKTTLINAIAHEYQLNLYAASLMSMVDEHLSEISTSLRPDSILVFEDVDCMAGREENDAPAAAVGAVTTLSQAWGVQPRGHKRSGVTLSAMLNMLDGLTNLGNIVIMTTNYPEKLDDALLRSERVNLHVRLGPDPELYVRMYERFYPETKYDLWLQRCKDSGKNGSDNSGNSNNDSNDKSGNDNSGKIVMTRSTSGKISVCQDGVHTDIVSSEQKLAFADECVKRKLSIADLQAHFRANINNPLTGLKI